VVLNQICCKIKKIIHIIDVKKSLTFVSFEKKFLAWREKHTPSLKGKWSIPYYQV
jgi:hypothetical protein